MNNCLKSRELEKKVGEEGFKEPLEEACFPHFSSRESESQTSICLHWRTSLSTWFIGKLKMNRLLFWDRTIHMGLSCSLIGDLYDWRKRYVPWQQHISLLNTNMLLNFMTSLTFIFVVLTTSTISAEQGDASVTAAGEHLYLSLLY